MPTARVDPNKVKPAGKKMDPAEQVVILRMSKEGKSNSEIAKAINRSTETVRRFLVSMADTRELGEAILQANAVKLVNRVIQKADVGHAIDILSRPNMGVLAPHAKSSGQGGGLQVSVAVGSCGTVVKVEQGATGAKQLPESNLQQPAIEGQVVASEVSAG